MANRITVAELKEIIDTSRSDTVLTTIITTANLMVTEHLESNENLSDDQLKEIERWLAAHLLASGPDRQVQSESADGVGVSYGAKTGMGLDGTTYGQTVKLLDTTGILAAVVGARKATVYAVRSFD